MATEPQTSPSKEQLIHAAHVIADLILTNKLPLINKKEYVIRDDGSVFSVTSFLIGEAEVDYPLLMEVVKILDDRAREGVDDGKK